MQWLITQFLLASLLVGAGLNTRTQEIPIQEAPQTVNAVASTLPELPPILLKIAKCESTNRQFDSNGKVLRGKVNPHDVGFLQINETYHRAAAERMGYDIDTLEGNMRYGLWLYKAQGTKPWIWSKPCWSKG